ncbi:BCAS3 microtubule associated cell migration factor-like [Saccoglossus kowalevskii]
MVKVRSDKSYMASVVDFLHDAYAATQHKDDKEQIVWIRFEHILSSGNSYDYIEADSVDPPLLLLLGYTNGLQIWTIPISGEAQELLSMRQGPIRIAKLLPSIEQDKTDPLHERRPLLAVCDGAGISRPFCSVSVVSLKTGDQVHSITFKSPVVDILCNKHSLVVALQEKVAVFDSCTFQNKFCIVSCYPASTPNLNPLALGTRWLAYADKKLISVHQSGGGMSGDGIHSYAATVISAAKVMPSFVSNALGMNIVCSCIHVVVMFHSNITKGLSIFGETVGRLATGKDQRSSTWINASSQTNNTNVNAATSAVNINSQYDKIPGVVTIIDTSIMEGELDMNEESSGDGIIAHFPAHLNESISAMQFDPSGALLVTAGSTGHSFHVFRVFPHPWQPSQAAVHHLYILHRGDTSAKVQDIVFSLDSRWVCVSTLRGTTHVFPITPYGGSVGVRTHTSVKVVNKESRFHKSAGLEDITVQHPSSCSPLHKLSSSPTSSGVHSDDHIHTVSVGSIVQYGNPRLPPYPHPITQTPLAQIKQMNPLVTMTGSSSAKHNTSSSQSTTTDHASYFPVAAYFSPSRASVFTSSPKVREKSDQSKVSSVDSLYIMGCHGKLIEYMLDAHGVSGSGKKTDEAVLEVTTIPKLHWILQRSPTWLEFRPPFAMNNPLISPQPDTDLYMTDDAQFEADLDDGFRGDDEDWLPEVEMVTHAGPHRRLWMGPQFQFKTFNSPVSTTVLSSQSSALLSQSPETANTDIYDEELDIRSIRIHPVRSKPMPTPSSKTNDAVASSMPTLIEAGSGSFDQTSTLLEVCAGSSWPDRESARMHTNDQVEEQLKQTLAEAMLESPLKEPPHSTTITGGQQDIDDCVDNYSSSSNNSVEELPHRFATASTPHNIDHVLVFPSNTNNNSPDSL